MFIIYEFKLRNNKTNMIKLHKMKHSKKIYNEILINRLVLKKSQLKFADIC